MSIIKIQTAFLYKGLNIVIVGEKKGSFKDGDVLYNIDNPIIKYLKQPYLCNCI